MSLFIFVTLKVQITANPWINVGWEQDYKVFHRNVSTNIISSVKAVTNVYDVTCA